MHFKEQFTTVTPLSKAIALTLIVALPFLGFYAGIQYQRSVATLAPQSLSWVTYTNQSGKYEIQYPDDWFLDKDHTTDLEINLTKQQGTRTASIHIEKVSQTLGRTSAKEATDSIVAKMKAIVKPVEPIAVGEYSGYEVIGMVCTMYCTGSSQDVYSLMSEIHFSARGDVYEAQYIEGIDGSGSDTQLSDWQYYQEFKDILATLQFSK